MNDNKSEIERFLNVKKVNDRSERTIANYAFILNELNGFLKSKPFRETTESDIFAFISYKKDNGLASTSINAYKIVIKLFYRFLYDLPRHQYPQQVKNLNNGNNKRKMPIRPETILTKQDVAHLTKYCLNYRDEAFVVSLYESGCRAGEFLNINIEHLHFDEKGIVLVVTGKTGERRIRLVESMPFLKRWIENHPLKDEEGQRPLWCRIRKPFVRMSYQNIQVILKRIKKRSNFKKPLNPHHFRHSRLTELSKYLTDGKLKIFAGWSASSKMAGIYVHLSGADIDEDLCKIAGVETKEEKPKVSPLKIRKCPRCGAENKGTAQFCDTCMMPLTEKASQKLISETMETEKLTEEIQDLKEKTKSAGEVTDSMWKVIDELKKEIRELKANQ